MHQKKNINNILRNDCLRQQNLKLKMSKCKLLQREIHYLIFIISRDGIMADPDKVKVRRQMQTPTCTHDARSFIGMCSDYRRLIPNFSAIAKHLIQLTKKFDIFEWNKECQAAVGFLKETLTTVPTLAYPYPNKPCIVHADANDESMGGMFIPRPRYTKEDETK